jgi:hypothetical protein
MGIPPGIPRSVSNGPCVVRAQRSKRSDLLDLQHLPVNVEADSDGLRPAVKPIYTSRGDDALADRQAAFAELVSRLGSAYPLACAA